MSDLFIRWGKARTSLARTSPWPMWFVSPSSRISHDFSESTARDIKRYSMTACFYYHNAFRSVLRRRDAFNSLKSIVFSKKNLTLQMH